MILFFLIELRYAAAQRAMQTDCAAVTTDFNPHELSIIPPLIYLTNVVLVAGCV